MFFSDLVIPSAKPLSADMCSFFDPCVDEVIYLVQGQMTQIEAKRTRVKVNFPNFLLNTYLICK